MLKKITKGRVLEIVNGKPIYNSNGEVVSIEGGKRSLSGLKGVKLSYAIAKNMKGLEAEVEALKDARYKSEKLDEYNKEYSEIIEAEAKRDENGNMVYASANSVALKSATEYQAKVKALNEKYAEELEKQKAAEKEFEALLKEEIEFEFYEVAQSELPDDITVQQMEVVFEMLKD